MRISKKVIDALGSFWLASVLLVLLMVLVLAGTFEQARRPLGDVLHDYFESLYVVHYWGGRYPTPLPGGALLFSFLFVNLLLGAILRARIGRTTIWIFVVHAGILLLFVGAFVQRGLAVSGLMTVWEPRPAEDTRHVSDRFQSPDLWEVAVVREGDDRSQTEFVVPQDAFDGLGEGDTLRCRSGSLPFDVVLRGYVRNARVEEEPEGRRGEGAEGWRLVAQPPVTARQREAGQRNMPGLYARLEGKASPGAVDVLLWGERGRPFRTSVGGDLWSVDLRPRSWQLPFRIALDEFVHEFHPGTGMPSRFSSYVKVEETAAADPAERDVHITMNEPLRYDAYTLYQTNWGPQDPRGRRPDGRLYSVFEVVYNPTDHWLLGISWTIWACAIIFLGLVVHYGLKLIRYLEGQPPKAVAATGRSS